MISNVEFVEIDEEGHTKITRTSGLIISNTCDLQRKKFILVAPAIPIDESDFKNQAYLTDLKKNTIFEKMYLPSFNSNPEFIIDFSRISPLRRNAVMKKIDDSSSLKITSLSKEGHFFFNLKLITYILRPESADIIRLSNTKEN